MEIYAKHVPNLVKKHSVKRFIKFVNKCWKMDINVKFILYMFKLYNKWGSLIMKIIWYVINGDQYASYVTYLPFIPIRSRE